jgi:hypothetical protein
MEASVLDQRAKRILSRALHPATPLAAAGLVLAVFVGLQWLAAQQKLEFGLYAAPIDPSNVDGKSCHDLAYPEIRCFDTPEEMFDDQIRLSPSRAVVLQEPGKPAYVLRDGRRSSASGLVSFEKCHALAFPEIRCFDTPREAIDDAVTNFPAASRSARDRLAALAPSR